jgi:hypothetical protein
MSNDIKTYPIVEGSAPREESFGPLGEGFLGDLSLDVLAALPLVVVRFVGCSRMANGWVRLNSGRPELSVNKGSAS